MAAVSSLIKKSYTAPSKIEGRYGFPIHRFIARNGSTSGTFHVPIFLSLQLSLGFPLSLCAWRRL